MAPPGTPTAPTQLGSSAHLVRGPGGGGRGGLWVKKGNTVESATKGRRRMRTEAFCPVDSQVPANSRNSLSRAFVAG